ncbi:MAG TPA: DUF4097 family beta strand repeat-containing protein [Candidatus Hydrogenedentes bacterium]|nr:DUF4097 family beta strand repeat-containing protein [Candidatus Hydrogenedentota bacterium]
MNPNLKSILTALTIAMFVVVFCARVLAPKLPPMVGKADVQENRAFAHANPGKLVLDNTDGWVRITTHTGEKILGKANIRAYRRGGTTEAELASYVSSLVQVKETPDALVVSTEPVVRAADYDLFVEYDIQIPVGTHVSVSSNNGNVWISPGCGDVRVLGRNSDIDVAAPSGSVHIESVNGRIHLAEAPAGGTLRTVNGDVYAQVDGGNLDVETDNGVIRAQVSSASVETANLTSQNGGVTLEMADDVSASITARASRGLVVSQVPIDTQNGTSQRRYIEGTVGDGRSAIKLDTLNGNILIARSN